VVVEWILNKYLLPSAWEKAACGIAAKTSRVGEERKTQRKMLRNQHPVSPD
jgi:hypothetical protein